MYSHGKTKDKALKFLTEIVDIFTDMCVEMGTLSSVLQEIYDERKYAMDKTDIQPESKVKEWEEFSEKVKKHIQEYVIPGYGDYPDEMIAGFSPEDMATQIVRYAKRLNTTHRDVRKDGKGDPLKIAHYACMLHTKMQLENKNEADNKHKYQVYVDRFIKILGQKKYISGGSMLDKGCIDIITKSITAWFIDGETNPYDRYDLVDDLFKHVTFLSPKELDKLRGIYSDLSKLEFNTVEDAYYIPCTVMTRLLKMQDNVK